MTRAYCWVIAVIVSALLVASAAFGSTSWSGPTSIGASSSVSCPSSSFCVAVDGAGQAYTYGAVQPPPTAGAPR